MEDECVSVFPVGLHSSVLEESKTTTTTTKTSIRVRTYKHAERSKSPYIISKLFKDTCRVKELEKENPKNLSTKKKRLKIGNGIRRYYNSSTRLTKVVYRDSFSDKRHPLKTQSSLFFGDVHLKQSFGCLSSFITTVETIALTSKLLLGWGKTWEVKDDLTTKICKNILQSTVSMTSRPLKPYPFIQINFTTFKVRRMKLNR